MTCKHVNIGDIKLTFKSIRETTMEVNEYNSECTRLVLHIYEGFTWYLITTIVPFPDLRKLCYRDSLQRLGLWSLE